jgi:hypothetical protein
VQLPTITTLLFIHQWTLVIHVESLNLPNANVQELPSVIGPTKTNKDLTLSTWNTTQFNPFIVEKITMEQVTEITFISNLQDCYYKGKVERSASPKDLRYFCVVASSSNKTNYHAFHSKSKGKHIIIDVNVVKVVVRKHAIGLTNGAHSDLEKKVKYFRNCTSCFRILTTTKMQYTCTICQWLQFGCS